MPQGEEQMSQGAFRLGTSGWQYRHWRGVFYPEGLPTKAWFSHYSREFDTVEVNNTFYRLPEERVFARWRDQAPPGFCYALKFSRYGSHIRRLRDPEETIGRFLERAAPLGPILVQLPPSMPVDAGALDAFLAAAPRSVRWAVEFREPSWLTAETFGILRRHGAALCIHDKIPDHPQSVTTGFTYVRFHGAEAGGDYGEATLSTWARRIRGWQAEGLDCWAFFNNDWQGYAIRNARTLRSLVAG